MSLVITLVFLTAFGYGYVDWFFQKRSWQRIVTGRLQDLKRRSGP